jgi:hypothetical protein
MNTDASATIELQEPVWRFVEFYITVPWPIAWPENRYIVKPRAETLDWMPVPLDNLVLFLPEQIAEKILDLGNHNFVAFQFVRYPIEYVSPYERSSAVDTLADYSRYPAAMQASFQNPIHGEQPATRIETYETIVKMATCILDDGEGKLGRAQQRAFDRCLEEFAVFMESYVQTIGDLRSGFVSRATVFPLVPAMVIDPSTGQKEIKGIQAGKNFPFSPATPPELTQEQLDSIAVRFQMAMLGEPYSTVRQWQRVAHRAFHLDGDYAATVVAYHTAGEVFFDALLLRMTWEEITLGATNALTPEEAVALFVPPQTLRTRLGNCYHPRLEGGWDTGKAGNPIHTWISKVSALRNKVVHGGYRPKEQEASDALASLAEVEAYVEDLIGQLANVQRYPYSVYMMLGELGLERRGTYTKKIRETIEGGPPDWRRQFYEFRHWVIGQLA